MPKPEMSRSAAAIAMRAIGIPQLLDIEQMRGDGWFTVYDVMKESGLDRSACEKRMKSDRIERCQCFINRRVGNAYRLKPR